MANSACRPVSASMFGASLSRVGLYLIWILFTERIVIQAQVCTTVPCSQSVAIYGAPPPATIQQPSDTPKPETPPPAEQPSKTPGAQPPPPIEKPSETPKAAPPSSSPNIAPTPVVPSSSSSSSTSSALYSITPSMTLSSTPSSSSLSPASLPSPKTSNTPTLLKSSSASFPYSNGSAPYSTSASRGTATQLSLPVFQGSTGVVYPSVTNAPKITNSTSTNSTGLNNGTTCGQCSVMAEQVQVFYWPTASVRGDCARASAITAPPSGPTHAANATSNGNRTMNPLGGESIDVVNGFTYTFPSTYVSVVGAISVSNSCGNIGKALTNPTPVAVQAITTASYASWPTTCRSQGGYVDVVLNTLDQADIACPTWGLSDPFTTTCGSSTYLTATEGHPFNPVILVPTEILYLQNEWASCTNTPVNGPFTLPCGIYDPPHALQTQSAMVPAVTPPSDPPSKSPLPAQPQVTASPSNTQPTKPAVQLPQTTKGPAPQPASSSSGSGSNADPNHAQGGANNPPSDPSQGSSNTNNPPNQGSVNPNGDPKNTPGQGTGNTNNPPSQGPSNSNSSPNQGSNGSPGQGTGNTNNPTNQGSSNSNSSPNQGSNGSPDQAEANRNGSPNQGSGNANNPPSQGSDTTGGTSNQGGNTNGSPNQGIPNQGPGNLNGGSQGSGQNGAFSNGQTPSNQGTGSQGSPQNAPQQPQPLPQTTINLSGGSQPSPGIGGIINGAFGGGAPAPSQQANGQSGSAGGGSGAGGNPNSNPGQSNSQSSPQGSPQGSSSGGNGAAGGSGTNPGQSSNGQGSPSGSGGGGSGSGGSPAANSGQPPNSQGSSPAGGNVESGGAGTSAGGSSGGNSGQPPINQGTSPGSAGGGNGAGGSPNGSPAAFTPHTLTALDQTLSAINPSSVVVAGKTLSAGGPAFTANGNFYSVGPSGNLVAGALTQGPTPAQTLTFAGSTFTANSASQFVISGQTLNPGAAITVAGTPISLSPQSASNKVAVVGTNSQALITPAPVRAPATGPGVLTFAGSTYTATSGSYVINGNTLTPGGSIVVSGTSVSAAKDGSFAIVGASTQSLQTPAASGGPPLLTFGGSTYTADAASKFTVGGQTLSPGGSPIVVSGTTISEAPSGSGLVVAGSNTQVLGHAPSTTSNAAVMTFGGQTFTADAASAFTISGQVLTPGGVVTINGTPISEAAGASNVVIGSSTEVLTTAPVTSSVMAFIGSGSKQATPGISWLFMWLGISFISGIIFLL